MFGQNLTRWFFHMYYTGNEWIFAKYVQTRANKHEPMQKCIGCISHDLLPKIISKCSPPIGLKGKCITSSMMMSIVKDLHIPIRYGKVKVCVYGLCLNCDWDKVRGIAWSWHVRFADRMNLIWNTDSLLWDVYCLCQALYCCWFGREWGTAKPRRGRCENVHTKALTHAHTYNSVDNSLLVDSIGLQVRNSIHKSLLMAWIKLSGSNANNMISHSPLNGVLFVEQSCGWSTQEVQGDWEGTQEKVSKKRAARE